MLSFYGSEKQVKWARSIYQNFSSNYGSENLPTIYSAHFWIEHRESSLQELLQHASVPSFVFSSSFPHKDRNSALSCLKELSNFDIVLCDTETTGIGKGHEIIDIALVDIHGSLLFQSYIKPYSSQMTDKAFSIHGISQDSLQDKPYFSEVWATIDKIIKNKVLITYNTNFDIPMIRRSLQACNVQAPQINGLCLMKLTQAFFELEDPLKLSEACEKLHIDTTPIGKLHSAIADTVASLCVLRSLFSLANIDFSNGDTDDIDNYPFCPNCDDIINLVCCNCSLPFCTSCELEEFICPKCADFDCGHIENTPTLKCVNCNKDLCFSCIEDATNKCSSCNKSICETCYDNLSTENIDNLCRHCYVEDIPVLPCPFCRCFMYDFLTCAQCEELFCEHCHMCTECKHPLHK